MMSSHGFPITGNDRAAVLLVILFVVAVFVGGVIFGREYQKSHQEVFQSKVEQVGSFSDPLTGCQYLVTGNGVFPRMGQDQRQVCTKHDSKTEN